MQTIIASVFSSIFVTGAVGWLVKRLIEAGLKHEFDARIEQLRSDLRNSEADIRELRSGALSVSAARHEELSKRRINAAEAIWNATVMERRYNMASAFTSALKWEAISESIKSKSRDGSDMAKFGSALMETAGVKGATRNIEDAPERHRLFLPGNVWDYFDALRCTSTAAHLLLVSLSNNQDYKEFFDPKGINDVLIKVFPNLKDHINVWGVSSYSQLRPELEKRIMNSIIASLWDGDFHKAMIDEASAIQNYKPNIQADVLAAIPPGLKPFTTDPAPPPPTNRGSSHGHQQSTQPHQDPQTSQRHNRHPAGPIPRA